MNTKFTLKNFRVFDEKQGGTFDLKPITILTGCNSSGKSSLVKSILLLKNFFCQLDERSKIAPRLTKDFKSCCLDFGVTTTGLGKFDVVRNKTSRKGSKMTFQYEVFSRFKLKEWIQVEFKFAPEKNDTLNNGWLNYICVKTKSDNTVIYESSISSHKDVDSLSNKCKCQYNINAFKHRFIVEVLRSLAFDDLYQYRNDGCTDESLLLEKMQLWFKRIDRFVPNSDIGKFKTELKNYISSDYFKPAANGCDVHYNSNYYNDANLYLEVAELGTLFPMPILSALKDVNKQEVRRTIYCWISDIENQNNVGNGVFVNKFNYKPFLDMMLTEFEQSKHESFLSYFIDEEEMWLQSYEKQANRRLVGGLGRQRSGMYGLSEFDSWPEPVGEYGVWESTAKENMTYNTQIESVFDTKYFGDIFGLLHHLNTFIYRSKSDCGYEYMNYNNDALSVSHVVFGSFRKYVAEVMKEALSPSQFKNFEYIADTYSLPKRIYTSDKDELFGKLLFEYLEFAKFHKSHQGGFEVGSFINSWIKKFQIGNHVTINSVAEGLGVIVKIHKTPEDKNGTLLADEGFGITKLVGLLICIEMAIMRPSLDRFLAHTTIAIEEPENHLHPKYQSMLADIFAEANKKYRIHFIVETHSEYLVRKLQTLVAKKELTPADVSLQYLYSPDVEQRPKDEPQVKHIPIREDGILQEPFGSGFLDEADNLAMAILTAESIR